MTEIETTRSHFPRLEPPATVFACMIGHPTLHEGELREVAVGFIDGQLAANGVPLPQARTVANLVNAGEWAEAFQVVGDNERATRILERIREVVAA
ncbi:MAG TPA: hypothetical protein V6D12_03445 [Candidatus Obscuribacterales bacterium]